MNRDTHCTIQQIPWLILHPEVPMKRLKKTKTNLTTNIHAFISTCPISLNKALIRKNEEENTPVRWRHNGGEVLPG